MRIGVLVVVPFSSETTFLHSRLSAWSFIATGIRPGLIPPVLLAFAALLLLPIAPVWLPGLIRVSARGVKHPGVRPG
ncbi:hypothetical protein [Pseudomonas sp. NFIX28]|uniref:hypothetical protein n=1 Tax=Pseudomonas sp. NFIX28 TaxID=1566235 RepID=UPI0011133075|nr:hypothetical protein [Pseudomonas sp. NFIX28]